MEPMILSSQVEQPMILSSQVERRRRASIVLCHPDGSLIWFTLQYCDPYVYLNNLPTGMLYKYLTPPGLGRTSVIMTLYLIHDVLVPETQQLWPLHPNFPRRKDSLVLLLDFTVPEDLSVLKVVSHGIYRFLFRYEAMLGLSEDLKETHKRIFANGLEGVIPKLMEIVKKTQYPLICLIDSFDDVLLAAWCSPSVAKTRLQHEIDDLRRLFRQLGRVLTREGQGGMQKIFVFGSTSLRALFIGILMQDLTGNVNLQGLFGFRTSDLGAIIQQVVRVPDRETLLTRLRQSCSEYRFHDQDGRVSEPVFSQYKVVSQLNKYYPPSQRVVQSQQSRHDLTKPLLLFVQNKLREKKHFTPRHQHLLAFKKQDIDTVHLLDTNLSPVLLKSLLVDLGFYKAGPLETGSAGYFLRQPDLLIFPTPFSPDLLMKRVLDYLRMFPDRVANLQYEETLQLSLKWLFPELNIAAEIALYNDGLKYTDLFVIKDDSYSIVEFKNLSLERLNMTAKELLNVTDLARLTYKTLYRPGGDGHKLKTMQSFRVGELLEAAAKQVTQYAEAVRQGKMPNGTRFLRIENEDWVTISSTEHTEDIPIYPLVVVLLGGTRILKSTLDTMTTRVRYVPGPKVRGWRGFLKTLNYNM